MSLLRSLALVATLAAGCGDDAPGDAGGEAGGMCGVGAGVVELGEGGSRWRALPPSGGELEVVRGSQGGIHVLVGFRARDMDLNVSVHYRFRDAATGEPVGLPTDIELRPTLFSPDPMGMGSVRSTDLVILDNEMPSFERFVGREVIASLSVESRDGSHPCDTRRATLVNTIP